MNSKFRLTGFGKRACAAAAVRLSDRSSSSRVSCGWIWQPAVDHHRVGGRGDGRRGDSCRHCCRSPFQLCYGTLQRRCHRRTLREQPRFRHSSRQAPRWQRAFSTPETTAESSFVLKKTHLVTSATSTLLRIDSNNFGASNLYQNQTVGCGEGFDFSTYAYYVEVALSRTVENASAGIASIQIGKADLCLAPSANSGSAERQGSTSAGLSAPALTLPSCCHDADPTNRPPSGKIANEKGSDVGGVTTSSRVTTGSVAGLRKYSHAGIAIMPTAISEIDATIHAARARAGATSSAPISRLRLTD